MVIKASDIFAFLKQMPKEKTIIIGVGNVLKKDDGIGPKIIEKIQPKIAVHVIDCGESPENYIAPIRRKEPKNVIIIDAVDFKAKPGSIRLFKPINIANETFTTHSISLRTFSDFIKAETGAEVHILAIQPDQVAFGTELSEFAKKASEKIENGLLEVFGNNVAS